MFDEVMPVLEQMKCAGLILGVISNFDDRLRKCSVIFEVVSDQDMSV